MYAGESLIDKAHLRVADGWFIRIWQKFDAPISDARQKTDAF